MPPPPPSSASASSRVGGGPLRRLAILAGALAVGFGCADANGPAATTGDSARGTLEIRVGALGDGQDGSRVAHATYDMLVEFLDDDGKWVDLVRIDALESTDPGGAMTYISPCQSGPNGNGRLGQVTITLLALRDGNGDPITDAALPVTASQQFYCLESRDVPAFFELTVMRSADTGFTDILVDIEHMRCAAKFDCQTALLPDETGQKQPTLVTGLTCRGAGVDNVVVFRSEWTCFDGDGIPIAASPYVEVFNGFEGAPAQAFHNTASRLDPAFMAPFARCAFRARGLVLSRDGGPRDARFRQGAGHIAWDVEIRRDGEGGLVCEGTVTPGYTAVRADHAASPRDGGVRPTREAPLAQESYVLERVARRLPDCDADEQAAAESRLELVSLERERDAASAEIARLESLAEDRRAAVTLASALASHLANARAAAQQDPSGQPLYEALTLAVEAINALDAHMRAASWEGEQAARDAVRLASDAIWVLIADAEGGVFDGTHHDAAQAAAAGLLAAAGALVTALEGSIAQAQLTLADITSTLAGALAAHPALLSSMSECHARQREIDAIRYEHLQASFPWAQGEHDDPLVAAGFLELSASDETAAVELLTACAFGDADHIERIAVQVRTLEADGAERARGYVDLVRDPLSPRGFECTRAAGGECALLPLTEIPCAVGGEADYDDDGGYIIVGAP